MSDKEILRKIILIRLLNDMSVADIKKEGINDENIEDMFKFIDTYKVKIPKGFTFKILMCLDDKTKVLELTSKYGKCMDESIIFHLNFIRDDELKLKYIDICNSTEGKLLLASSLRNDKLKALVDLDDLNLYKLSWTIKNDEAKALVFKRITDIQYKLKVYSRIFDDKIRVKLINEYSKQNDKDNLKYMILGIDDKNIKKALIKKYYDMSKCSKYLDPKYSVKHDIFMGGLDALPEDLTFGVEIEADKGNALLINGYTNKILKNWVVKPDASIPNGVELTSPILHFNYHDLNEIYEICDFAKENGLVTTDLCGGHIHFGEQYLNSIDSYLWLYYLYTNMEKSLFVMSNKIGDIPREGYRIYATPIGSSFKDYLKNSNKFKSLDEFLDSVKKYYKNNKDLSLNVKFSHFKGKPKKNEPINTIEFRCPNGQLPKDKEKPSKDYGTRNIILNILLFGNLITLANKLSKLPMDKTLDNLINALDSSDGLEKVDILLKLLFKEPGIREEFKNRYITNNKLFCGNNKFNDKVMTIENMKEKRK